MQNLSNLSLNLQYPEPGLVKFESLGITRPTSNTDSSKTTSALGRVKRSLHLAKKKEQEDDILIPESSAGIHLTDNGKETTYT